MTQHAIPQKTTRYQPIKKEGSGPEVRQKIFEQGFKQEAPEQHAKVKQEVPTGPGIHNNISSVVIDTAINQNQILGCFNFYERLRTY